jgi:hypothetical protein
MDFEPDQNIYFERTLQQAHASIKLLVQQRDLFQAALCQWIAGRFTLVSGWVDGGARMELWLCIGAGDSPEKDMAIIVGRGAGATMEAHWADEIIDAAAASKSNTGYVSAAELILQYRDQAGKCGHN